jgi:hypothetical protein
VNKQRVLPFIPPSFPGSADSNNLIKPSEYLKSISDKRSSTSSLRSNSESEEAVMTVEEKDDARVGPPPPPLPVDSAPNKTDTNTDTAKKQQQPLSAISIQDLNSVQLRRTDKMVASKTFSAPTRSLSLQCLQSEPYLAQKTDLIAELKLSRDIPGIKKLKIERAKVEESKEKEMYTEISKQFTATKFVEKVSVRVCDCVKCGVTARAHCRSLTKTTPGTSYRRGSARCWRRKRPSERGKSSRSRCCARRKRSACRPYRSGSAS